MAGTMSKLPGAATQVWTGVEKVWRRRSGGEEARGGSRSGKDKAKAARLAEVHGRGGGDGVDERRQDMQKKAEKDKRELKGRRGRW
eukprot:363375-Chlamydomonas_euryale.AAC.4